MEFDDARVLANEKFHLNQTIFDIACENGKINIVKLMFYRLPNRINIRNGIRKAEQNNQIEVVKFLSSV